MYRYVIKYIYICIYILNLASNSSSHFVFPSPVFPLDRPGILGIVASEKLVKEASPKSPGKVREGSKGTTPLLTGAIWIHLKNISQIGSFSQVGMNIKKYLKPPPGNKFAS